MSKTIYKIIIHFHDVLRSQMVHTSNWIWKLTKKSILSMFTENVNKITSKSMFYESAIKQQIKYVVFNTKICNFSTKYLPKGSYSKSVSMNVLNFPKLPLLSSLEVTINMTRKQNSTRIQNSNPQLSIGLFLSIMPCKPKNYVICLFP